MNRQELARYIDHTLLKPEATPDAVVQVCREAVTYHFAAVCVNPVFVPLVAKELAGSDVAVCSVVGFPLGATSTASKVCETELAVAKGATEIDMVIPVGLLKAGKITEVREDIAAVAAACHGQGAILKVILEAVLLTNDEKVTACKLCQEAGADFVKTSTGFSTGGATAADVALMRKTVGPDMGVKAAGGIHNYEEAMVMIEAGATRIGASKGIAIVGGAPES
ncbi:MAG: deoxyribose-phosphate aldolase [Anaerolineae bacterium]|nr:deoxyribose-phosphate aldolase [Anaerolineae bacterium]